jgi:hypothetical protein
MIFIIFAFVCVIGQLVFRRGYPVAREMLPIYPVFVLVIADFLTHIKSNVIIKSVIALISVLLCLQFIMKINMKSTEDWSDNYKIRDEIFTYAISNDMDNKEEYKVFIDNHKNPAVKFYVQKFSLDLTE